MNIKEYKKLTSTLTTEFKEYLEDNKIPQATLDRVVDSVEALFEWVSQELIKQDLKEIGMDFNNPDGETDDDYANAPVWVDKHGNLIEPEAINDETDLDDMLPLTRFISGDRDRINDLPRDEASSDLDIVTEI